jgi:hypothetical protein
MARTSVGLVVILVLGFTQIGQAVAELVRSGAHCALSLQSLYSNCHGIVGTISNAAAYWAWLSVTVLTVALAAMKQERDARNLSLLCHLVDVADDSVVGDSRRQYSVVELKLLLAGRASGLERHDRWPSVFDTVPVNPKVVYAASGWIVAPFITLTFRQLQSLFSRQ